MRFYCVKCRKRFQARKVQYVTVRGKGRRVKMAKARCPDCGKWAYRIVG